MAEQLVRAEMRLSVVAAPADASSLSSLVIVSDGSRLFFLPHVLVNYFSIYFMLHSPHTYYYWSNQLPKFVNSLLTFVPYCRFLK